MSGHLAGPNRPSLSSEQAGSPHGNCCTHDLLNALRDLGGPFNRVRERQAEQNGRPACRTGAGAGIVAAADLAASGALDGLFAQIDAGDLEMTGDGGFIPGLIKAALERGLQVELINHLGYEKGDPDAAAHPNSRNGSTSKTVATQVGEVDLDVPRDRESSFVPRLVPKGSRRPGAWTR